MPNQGRGVEKGAELTSSRRGRHACKVAEGRTDQRHTLGIGVCNHLIGCIVLEPILGIRAVCDASHLQRRRRVLQGIELSSSETSPVISLLAQMLQDFCGGRIED